MIASYKFVQKLWLLHQKIKISPLDKKDKNSNEVSEFTNQLIEKITYNLEKFNYNVIIANLHEMYNFMNKVILKSNKNNNLIENYTKILYLLSPILPHFASECLEDLKIKNENLWPEIDPRFIKDNNVEIVIQINGKKRSIIKVERNEDESALLMKVKKDEKIMKFLNNQPITKYIFVKNRLINLIVK